MIKLEEFRAGCVGLASCCGDELPECCFRCVYLIYQEAACSLPYYSCGYSLPDRLTQSQPMCLPEPD